MLIWDLLRLLFCRFGVSLSTLCWRHSQHGSCCILCDSTSAERDRGRSGYGKTFWWFSRLRASCVNRLPPG